MEVRQQIADFVSALIWVYTLCIIAWIIVSWVLSFGVRIPYSRPVNAVLDFLRDVTNPFLRIFRRLGLQFGPVGQRAVALHHLAAHLGGQGLGAARIHVVNQHGLLPAARERARHVACADEPYPHGARSICGGRGAARTG